MKIALLIYNDFPSRNSFSSGNSVSVRNNSGMKKSGNSDPDSEITFFTAEVDKNLQQEISKCLYDDKDEVTICLHKTDINDPGSSFPVGNVIQHISSKQVVHLTRMESIVMDHLSKGMLYKEIAAITNRSMNTIKSHISHIYGKLNVKNRSEAIVEYLKFRPDPK
jgi:DNA-binding CsgD family transcriptional regulator